MSFNTPKTLERKKMTKRIPTTLLFCTTVAASACTKSNEKIAEDLCNMNLCEATQEELDNYADDISEYLDECISEGVDYLDSLEGDCRSVMREFYICASNLSCEDFQQVMFDEEGPCVEEAKAYADCEIIEVNEEEDFEGETYPADQYEPDGDLDQAAEILPGESQERTLQNEDDTDFVVFSAEEGKTYTIETFIEEGDYTDTVLTLRTNTYEYIDENDDKSDGTYDSVIEWTATSTDTFLIEVSTLSAGPYVLSLSEN